LTEIPRTLQGDWMSIEENIKCDVEGCHVTEKKAGYHMPLGWFLLEFTKGLGSSQYEKVTQHCCSKACAAKLLRARADIIDPPKVDMPKTGGPYRS
jgi:hypothetical protein